MPWPEGIESLPIYEFNFTERYKENLYPGPIKDFIKERLTEFHLTTNAELPEDSSPEIDLENINLQLSIFSDLYELIRNIDEPVYYPTPVNMESYGTLQQTLDFWINAIEKRGSPIDRPRRLSDNAKTMFNLNKLGFLIFADSNDGPTLDDNAGLFLANYKRDLRRFIINPTGYTFQDAMLYKGGLHNLVSSIQKKSGQQLLWDSETERFVTTAYDKGFDPEVYITTLTFDKRPTLFYL